MNKFIKLGCAIFIWFHVVLLLGMFVCGLLYGIITSI